MKNELKALIKSAKEYKEFQSIGNGAKLNCAIEAAEIALQEAHVKVCPKCKSEELSRKPVTYDSGLAVSGGK